MSVWQESGYCITGNDIQSHIVFPIIPGGTVFPITLKKQLRMQDIADKFNLPCLFVVDSGGAYLPEQVLSFTLS